MNMIDTLDCSICMEPINKQDLIYPQNCSCKIPLHQVCLQNIINIMNITCPICRKKNMIISYANQYEDEYDYFIYQEPDFSLIAIIKYYYSWGYDFYIIIGFIIILSYLLYLYSIEAAVIMLILIMTQLYIIFIMQQIL